MADPHQALKDACNAYERLKVDMNTKERLVGIIGQAQSMVFSYDSIPKTMAVQDWLNNLWGLESETVADCYHKRKADGEPYNLDFSNFGDAPYNYYELIEEHASALEKRDSLSFSDMLKTNSTIFNESEQKLFMQKCFDIDTDLSHLVGGVEIDIALAETEFEPGVTYAEKFSLDENSMSKTSLDGTKALIRCCTPIHPGGWSKADWEVTCKKFYADFGLPLLVSEFQKRIDSEDYTEPVEGV